MDQFLQAALRLQQYLVANHWHNQALIGPDPGIRVNYRLGRFIKSYLCKKSWRDNYYYLQAQGYWVLVNWELFVLSGNNTYREIAIYCSESMLTRQSDDGAWHYPNSEWKGRVAAVEGVWAATGLLETYQHTGDRKFLVGALRWHRFLVDKIGYQQVGNELAVNYFAHRVGARVPNNSTMLLGFLGDLTRVSGDLNYLEPVDGLLAFIRRVQMPTGELPYAVAGPGMPTYSQPHFQCYQYNAFECLDLIRYYEITEDKTVLPIIGKLLEFLGDGLARDGSAYYDCGKPQRRVIYHAAALGAAFFKAGQVGFEGYDDLAKRAYDYVLGLQKADGSFLYSLYDYNLLTDRRSYPRYLVMILHHLLLPATETGMSQILGRPNRFSKPIRSRA